MNEVGQGAGGGARTMLLVVLAAVAIACLIGAPVAGAATGWLASIGRDPTFAWSALNITVGSSGFAPVADDPVPWTDATTGQLCAAAITPTPAGHVIMWCRTSDDVWHQSDMTALWGAPAGVGDVREVAYSGQSVLFFRDASGEMWSLTRQAAGTWTAVNLTGTYGFATLAGDPWPLIDSATGQLCAVAATAPDGHVTEWCHQSDDAWLQFDRTAAGGAPAAVGTVVPGTDPATNQNVDFFREASGELWSLTRQASGAWVALNVTARSSGVSPIASDPMPVIDPQTGQLCVAATLAGTTGHVAEFCRQSDGSWLQLDLTALYGGGAPAGDVQPLVDPQFDQTTVYFRDAGGNLWSLTRGTDGRWTPAQIVASGATPMIVSDPEPIVDPQTNEPIVLVSGVTPPSTPAPPVILTTPTPKGPLTVHARFVIKWRWDGLGTVLRSIRVRGLPRRARLAVSCTGPECPQIRGRATGRTRIVTLLTGLVGQRFAPGDVIRITVTAPGLRPERIQLRIRRQRVPLARLLTG